MLAIECTRYLWSNAVAAIIAASPQRQQAGPYKFEQDSGGCFFLPDRHRPCFLFNGVLEFRPHPQQKRQLRHHKQRPDDQAHDIVDKGRLAPFIVVSDKLDHPADHKQS